MIILRVVQSFHSQLWQIKMNRSSLTSSVPRNIFQESTTASTTRTFSILSSFWCLFKFMRESRNTWREGESCMQLIADLNFSQTALSPADNITAKLTGFVRRCPAAMQSPQTCPVTTSYQIFFLYIVYISGLI